LQLFDLCTQDNVFLWEDDTTEGKRVRAKIGDFGLARDTTIVKTDKNRTHTTLRDSGSKRYLAPEHLSQAPVMPPGAKRPERRADPARSNSQIQISPRPTGRSGAASVKTHRGKGLYSKQKGNDVWGFGMIIYYVGLLRLCAQRS